jgi:hypothetical protein
VCVCVCVLHLVGSGQDTVADFPKRAVKASASVETVKIFDQVNNSIFFRLLSCLT